MVVALLSSLYEKPVPLYTTVCGEVGLAAARGRMPRFRTLLMPAANRERLEKTVTTL
jgi:predicted ATP-dependent serine protease